MPGKWGVMYLCVKGVDSIASFYDFDIWFWNFSDSERSCVCVFVGSILPLSAIVLFDFGIVLTVWYFVLVYFIIDIFLQFMVWWSTEI
jgi:hypothetical protein